MSRWTRMMPLTSTMSPSPVNDGVATSPGGAGLDRPRRLDAARWAASCRASIGVTEAVGAQIVRLRQGPAEGACGLCGGLPGLDAGQLQEVRADVVDSGAAHRSLVEPQQPGGLQGEDAGGGAVGGLAVDLVLSRLAVWGHASSVAALGWIRTS